MKKILILIWCFILTFPLYAQLNMTLIKHVQASDGGLSSVWNGEMSDVWGYEVDGNEYAIVTMEDGISILDITDPLSPSEVFYSTGPNTFWRDAKVWGDHLYVVNEAASSDGMKIIDMGALPGGTITAADVSWWDGDNGVTFTDAHNIFIDENGFAYIVGSDVGSIIVDVATDPDNPTVVGQYDDEYVHDVFVRGDTLWTCEFYAGHFAAIDVTDKSAETFMAAQETPSGKTHNIWLTDNNQIAFASDEVNNGYVTSYDVSDLTDIRELDRYRPGSGAPPHNAFVVSEDFVVNSFYKEGVIVLDGSRPQNMIKVGQYDTSPFAGTGFAGCWGVYPYLPSGVILATDIEQGLFILQADYKHAAYLEGFVTDVNTGNPINGATVSVVTTDNSDNSNLLGEYATGAASSGTYEVTVSAPGYDPISVTGIVLTEGQVTNWDFQLGTYESTEVQARLCIEGAYIGNGEMSTTLNDLGLIPLDQPFNTVPWNYPGMETVTAVPTDAVDWILVELRAVPSSMILETRAGFLMKDGMVKDLNGTDPIQFNAAYAGGNYYVLFRHRNHIDVRSRFPQVFPNLDTLDITLDPDLVNGLEQMKLMSDGKYALVAGDQDGDGDIDGDDFDNEYSVAPEALLQYIEMDCNLNGLGTVKDYNLYRENKGEMGSFEVLY